MLELLARHGAHATFFAVGSQLETQPALARRIVREGHALGNHTYRHADLTRLPAAAVFAELDRTQATIRRLTGVPTRLLRPPYGAMNGTVRALAAQRGYRIALWDVDPQDWRGRSSASIAASVLADVRPGAVVLLHDGGGNRASTVAALRRVLETLSARGYRFEALR